MSESDVHHINKAISILNAGGILIFPTDTAFGIGCRIDKPETIDKLFAIRQRPTSQALPVLVRNKDQALPLYYHPSDIVRRLMETYWPGGLTIIDTCNKNMIYSPIRGGGDTVGLRHPKHETLQKILDGIEVPIVGPSANIHKESTPYRLEDISKKLIGLVDYVVPGVCTAGNVSTVVDCSVTPYKIVRQGAVQL